MAFEMASRPLGPCKKPGHISETAAAAVKNDLADAVYIGSADDVVPYFLFPNMHWTLVTKEGLGWWKYNEHGHSIENKAGYLASLRRYVVSEVHVQGNHLSSCSGPNELHVFFAHDFPAKLSNECLQRLAKCTVLFLKGWLPNQRDLARLCPQLTHCIHSGPGSPPPHLSVTTIPDYDYTHDLDGDGARLHPGGDAIWDSAIREGGMSALLIHAEEVEIEFMSAALRLWPHALRVITPAKGGGFRFLPWSPPSRKRPAGQEPVTPADGGKISRRWQANFDKLRAWLQKHGGQYPRRREKTRLGKFLHKWIRNQKAERRGLQRSGRQQLGVARARLLEQLPGWQWQVRSVWQQRLEDVQAFIDLNSRLPSRTGTDAHEDALLQWLSRQLLNTRLSDAQRAALRQVSRVPATGSLGSQNWDAMLQLLQEWFCSMQIYYPFTLPGRGEWCSTPEYKALGQWLRKQVAGLRWAHGERKRLRKKTRVLTLTDAQSASLYDVLQRNGWSFAKGVAGNLQLRRAGHGATVVQSCCASASSSSGARMPSRNQRSTPRWEIPRGSPPRSRLTSQDKASQEAAEAAQPRSSTRAAGSLTSAAPAGRVDTGPPPVPAQTSAANWAEGSLTSAPPGGSIELD